MADSDDKVGWIWFVGALTLASIALKLTGYVDWAWFWVLSPAWAYVGIMAVAISALLLLASVTNHRIGLTVTPR